MKLDVLAFGAHPDDVELSCSGTLIKLQKSGKKIGIVDLTEGELGTRGTIETRYAEAAASSKILKLSIRENLNLGDGWFDLSQESVLAVITAIRKYRPEIVFANAIRDRHPDHGKGAELLKRAMFMAGLAKIETTVDGEKQEAWRPKHLYHYIQYQYIQPDVVVDISSEFEKKMESVLAFKTQFYDPKSGESNTLISSEKFLKVIEARAREFGSAIEKEFGEGFTHSSPVEFDFENLL